TLALERTVFRFAHAARLAEIDVAGQFANDKDIETGHDLGLEARGIGQLRVKNRGAQVGEQAQRLAQAQNRLFRAQFPRQLVVFPVAHRSEQNRIGVFGQLEGRRGQRVAVQIVRSAAHRRGLHFEIEARSEERRVVKYNNLVNRDIYMTIVLNG